MTGRDVILAINARLGRIPYSVIALLARVSMAAVFWQSGQTKFVDWHLSENAIYLFREEYKLPFIDALLATYLAAIAEHVLPMFLALGLAARWAALGLVGMTLVIQIFVYPEAWPTHGSWIACLLLIVARGPGEVAMDNLIFRSSGRVPEHL